MAVKETTEAVVAIPTEADAPYEIQKITVPKGANPDTYRGPIKVTILDGRTNKRRIVDGTLGDSQES
jgi:hypothetical protein